MQTNPSAARLAMTVVDDLLFQFRLISVADLASLRKTGATNQELILSALIAAKKQRSVTKVYSDAKNGFKSWGALLDKAQIHPSEIQQEFSVLLRRS
ncbi:MAG: hypothetical protein PHY09_04130 [Desulfuromonadaceae bacterium]|nr:hypothetical protein [Desulfuromonadaceae bacterium]MDD5105769.1 hypothetical protein [Desulfuromonadaceae bacterium]